MVKIPRKVISPLLRTVLVLAAFPAGAAIGDAVRARDPGPAVPAAEAGALSSETGSTAEGGAAAKPSSNMSDGEAADVTYSFPDQFIVPLMRNGELHGMIVLSLAIETGADDQDRIAEKDTRLRDGLLRSLLAHANSGGFDGNFTSEAHLNLLHDQLVSAARNVVGKAARDVLITEIAYQGTA